jgi:hypothetical protein
VGARPGLGGLRERAATVPDIAREYQMLVFVVPLIHPAVTVDWAIVQARVRDTARSLCAQQGDDWRAILVANEEAILPGLPEHLEVVRVQEPPPSVVVYARHNPDANAWRTTVRRDKGRKILAGLLHAGPGARAHVMPVDADDLVSNRLAEFVGRHADQPGWFVQRGYVHQVGHRLMYLHPEFHLQCGTCFLLRADLLQIPARTQDANDEYVQQMFGSHQYAMTLFAEAGHPLAPLPFPGVVYRIGHGQNISGSPGLRRMFFARGTLQGAPLKFIRRIGRLRPVTAAIRDEMLAGGEM